MILFGSVNISKKALKVSKPQTSAIRAFLELWKELIRELIQSGQILI